MENNLTTNTQTWLQFDLEGQSGSIWTDEKSGILQECDVETDEQTNFEYFQSENIYILGPDSIKYGNNIIADEPHFLS